MAQIDDSTNLFRKERAKLKKSYEDNLKENERLAKLIHNLDIVLGESIVELSSVNNGDNKITLKPEWSKVSFAAVDSPDVKLMTSGGIVRAKYPDVTGKVKVRYLTAISNALQQLTEQGKLKRAEWGGKGWLYGTPDKFNDDNTPKTEYLPADYKEKKQ